MAKRTLISTGLIAFGVGLAVGARHSLAKRFVTKISHRFGFDIREVFVELPAPGGKSEAALSREGSALALRDGEQARRKIVRRRSFSRSPENPPSNQ